MAVPSKAEVYAELFAAADEGDNASFLRAQRLLNVYLIRESDGDAVEQARLSSELFKITKEMIRVQGLGDRAEVVTSSIGEIGLGDVGE